MSVIIRLQNLPWAANAADIRTYFSGLSIPEGGVHIVGGEQGDAFIAFSTDEDARQAMQLDGGKLKEVKIKLFLSSRAEMLRVIEQARQQTLSVHNLIHGTAPSAVTPAAQPTLTSQSAPATATNITATYAVQALKPNEDEDDTKSRDDDNSRDRRERYRSPSRERGRSRGRDNSRDRSRGRYRDSRRRRDRSRSRDRHRRRSRSRDRRRSSRDRDTKDKDYSRNKKKDGKETDVVEIRESPKVSYDDSSWEASKDPPKSVPLLPDPPAVPPVLLQLPNAQNGKDPSSSSVPSSTPQSTPAAPVINFANSTQERPPFTYNPQMGPMNQAFMQMRGREGWNPAQMVGVMDPMQMGMPRPMMNNMEMGMPPGFPAFGMPMFPHNPNDPTAMWRPPMMQQAPQEVTKKEEDDLSIEIRGLPLNASYKDVKKLFDGLIIPPDGIKMINDNQGNRTGIAYVRFTSSNHKNAALNQNGKKVRSNIVEVIHLKDSIFNAAIDNFKPEKEMSVDMDLDNGESSDSWPRGRERERDNGKDSRDRDRSDKEKERDRSRRNGDPRMNSESRLGDPRHDSRMGDPRGHESRSGDPRGHESRISNDPRLNSDPRLNNESRINSDPRTNADPRTSNKPHLEENSKHTDCILIQGLPLHYNENDIADFFEESGLIPANIFLVFDNLGQPVGDAFCQFGSYQEAQQATSRDGDRMGRNVISVQFIGKEEMERAMGAQQGMQIPQGNMMWGMSHRGGPQMSRGGMGGLLSGGGMLPMSGGSSMMGGGPAMGGSGMMMSRFRDEEGSRFSSRHDEERPTRWDRPDDRGDDRRFRGRSERRERGGPRGRGGSRNDPYAPRRGGPPRGMGGGSRRDISPPPYMDGNSIESFGRPGCVVSLENLHFRAEIEEVIDFFKGFNVEHQNVIRRFDESGRPTGDARVSLNSPSDALRAVKVLNYKLLRGRAVKVSLLQ